METKLRFKNRAKVFNAVRNMNLLHLGGIAQNEMILRETDILVEFIAVDREIDKLQEYKKLIISEIEQV